MLELLCNKTQIYKPKTFYFFLLLQFFMPSTRRQKAKARKSREMAMMSDFDYLDVMLGNEKNNPIERELTDAIEQSSAHGDVDTNTYRRDEYGNFTYENDSVRRNDVRQYFKALSNEFSLRLSQEIDSMMSMMHSQINRAITTAIAERVIPEIQNIANSMSSTGHRDTQASMSPNSQENRENASGHKIKIAKKDSVSVGDLRDTTGCGSYTKLSSCSVLCVLARGFARSSFCIANGENSEKSNRMLSATSHIEFDFFKNFLDMSQFQNRLCQRVPLEKLV